MRIFNISAFSGLDKAYWDGLQFGFQKLFL